jgi:CRP/FNR family cyclic AMP-dependent transcriptional regulator
VMVSVLASAAQRCGNSAGAVREGFQYNRSRRSWKARCLASGVMIHSHCTIMHGGDVVQAGKPNPFWDNLFRRRADWKEQAAQALAETPVFAGIPMRVVRGLVRGMYHRVYADGEPVFRAGEPGLGMYVVLSGEVTISLGRRRFATLGPGDFFGEVALFGEEARTADATAVGETELAGLFRPDLQEWVERSPRLGVRILLQLGQVQAERLRQANAQLVDAGTGS